MKKIKLLGLSKREYRSEYIFPREQIFFEIVRKVLPKLGFDENNSIIGFGRPWDGKDESPILNEEDGITNKFYNERIFNFVNKDYSVDIIFFLKKVVLIFNYKKDKQQEISKAIGGFILDK